MLAMFGAAGGCKKAPDAGSSPPDTPSGPADVSDKAVDLLEEIANCDIYHRGQLLDLGSPASESRFGRGFSAPTTITNVTREGATWAQVAGRSVEQSFHLDHSGPVFVGARIRGIAARSAAVRLDGHSIGSLVFGHGDVEVVATKPTESPLEAGAHTLSLVFHGITHGQAYAEIDWLRVGEPDDDPSTFAAPTLRDLVIDGMIADQPRRAVALRSPGLVRCMVAVHEGMQLNASIGYSGSGRGEAEIRVLEPGQSPTTVHSAQVGGETAAASDGRILLDTWAGKLVGIELVAVKTDPGGRILFGEPVILRHATSRLARGHARLGIIVVLSSTDRSHLPPYADVPALAALTNLAASSAVFRRHRATTTVVTGSMASLLTGLAPQTHAVLDSAARLSARLPTMATMARDGRISTAMFTANPTSFEAFGFARGWDRFEAFSPISGALDHAPLLDATRWIETRQQESKDSPLLLLVHSRGGHPPWIATADEIRNLPPADYLGPIEARRGGQVLNRARGKRPKWRLSTADRQRLEGFFQLALIAEDQKLGALITSLQKLGVWDSTLLIVTSDVSRGGPSRVPFGDGEKLDEDLLELPLIVHFPDGRFGGKFVDAPTTVLDLIGTVQGAFGLRTQQGARGADLYEIAANPEYFALRAQFAMAGREYAARVGDLVLRGETPKAPLLCDLAQGTPCAAVSSPAQALVADAMWRQSYLHYRDSWGDKALSAREPATLDPDTVAALTVWGNQENKP
jgi:hypothetical protein